VSAPILGCVLLALIASAPDDVKPSPDPSEEFAGCYRLTFAWSPPWKAGDGAWFMPPPELEFSRQPTAERGRFRVLPDADPVIPGKRMLRADWGIESGFAVVRWENGFAGVALRLRRQGKRLEGTARTEYDAGKPETGSVVADRVLCKH
jgi:hypothetical protein